MTTTIEGVNTGGRWLDEEHVGLLQGVDGVGDDVAQDTVKVSGDGEFLDDTVKMYLREIGRHGLLTAQEEIRLAQRMEEGACLAKTESDLRRIYDEPTAFQIVVAIYARVADRSHILVALADALGVDTSCAASFWRHVAVRSCLDSPHDGNLVA